MRARSFVRSFKQNYFKLFENNFKNRKELKTEIFLFRFLFLEYKLVLLFSQERERKIKNNSSIS